MLLQIFSQADTTLKRWILEFAAGRKKAEVRNGIIRNDSLWDKLFFNKIQVGDSRSESEVKELLFLLAMTGFLTRGFQTVGKISSWIGLSSIGTDCRG